MKKIIIIFLITSNVLNAQFLKTEEARFNFWIDPNSSIVENEFPHFGLELEKGLRWGYASIATSHFEGLTVPYTDLVGTIGLQFNLFNYENVRYYAGFRMGVLWRDFNSPFGLVGGVLGFDLKLTRFTSKTQIYLGLRAWLDYRADQDDQFFGDSDGFEYIIFNNPKTQENGAIVLSISL